MLAAPAERYLCSFDHGLKGFKARQNLAIAHERLGGLAAAESQWRTIIAEVPACQQGWLGLAENLALQGRTGELAGLAAELRSRVESPRGGEPAASIIEARALMAARQPAQAVAVLEEAMRRHPDDEGVLREYCQATFGHGDPLDCVAGLESLLNRCPDDASSWQNPGAAYMQAGGWEGAAHAFESSLELRPDDPKTLWLLAGALYRLGCPDRARQALRRLLRVDPFNEQALESLAQLQDQEICV